MALAWMYMAAAAIGGAGMLWHELQKQKEEQAADDKQSPSKCKRKKQPVVSTSFAEAAIPELELQQLQAFLQKVYSWRGWHGGAYHVTQAWHAAEMAAATAAAGSWEQDFDLKQMNDANCNALLGVIDGTFFGGKLLKHLAAKHRQNQQRRGASAVHAAVSHNSSSASADSTSCSTGASRSCSNDSSTISNTSSSNPAVHNSRSHADAVTDAAADSITIGNRRCSANTTTCASADGSSSAAVTSTASCSNSNSRASKKSSKVTCKVVEWYGPTDTWLAYFDECNVIFINSWRWVRKDVSAEHPLNVEGVVCTNRLQMLLHTLAHELVHAVVFHVFPEMDKSSPAYVENDRHGPIFQLLNKQLFGHSSDALERVQLLEAHL